MPRSSPRTLLVLRLLAAALVLLYPIGAATLLLTSDAWAVNRANVAVWSAVTSVTGGRSVITPEVFADLANIVLFVPFFLALAVLVPRWWWILVGAAMSTAVELFQRQIGTRDATVVDVATNTLGAALGTALGILIVRRVSAGAAARATTGRTTPGAAPSASADAPTGVPDDLR